MAPDILRVGVFPDGLPPDYRSHAVILEPAGGEVDPARPQRFTFSADGDQLTVTAPKRPGERFFGCGERTSGLEKTGSHQVFWNVDPPAGHTASFNNLYTSIPFVLSLQDGPAHGVFVDYPGRRQVGLAKADPRRVAWWAAGGDPVS